eukprot:TRINITY_DN10514_c0_g1_i1.p1 TRINITY_DN10514_c0_g1~~TRINITY_DN10514_c0_g1_i1.p1  ORF type:complete len:489 (-),score=168.15 TRINITY_DN10514_c0_g1_i1:40-1461(-)
MSDVKAPANEVNPHIPKFIAQAPWYLNQDSGLRHQQGNQKAESSIYATAFRRGEKAGPAATKFRKGACENCGAMTHVTKLCFERPRKLGAKWTGQQIAPDEKLHPDQKLNFDESRDRWNNYEPETDFTERIEMFNKVEEERRKKKKEEELNKFMTEPDPDNARFPSGTSAEQKKADTLVDSDDEKAKENEDFLDNNSAPVGVKKDAKTRTTVRNLRIREDTAKYLRNLDLDSAEYNPKSRIMKGNPTPHIKDAIYTGDDYVRGSEDVASFTQFQAFAFKNYDDNQMHIQAAPSAAEYRFKQFKESTQDTKAKNQEDILKKYGQQQYSEPKGLLSQSEDYVEYRFDGSIVKGSNTGIPKSKYDEDVLHSNHTQIWGSYWEDGSWGYGCCRNLVKQSYCTGRAGIAAKESANKVNEEPKEEKKEIKFQSTKERNQEEEKKRSHAIFKGATDVTQEEIEAYQQKKKRFDDPMKDFI